MRVNAASVLCNKIQCRHVDEDVMTEDNWLLFCFLSQSINNNRSRSSVRMEVKLHNDDTKSTTGNLSICKYENGPVRDVYSIVFRTNTKGQSMFMKNHLKLTTNLNPRRKNTKFMF